MLRKYSVVIIAALSLLFHLVCGDPKSNPLGTNHVAAKKLLSSRRQVCRDSEDEATCNSFPGCEWFAPENTDIAKCIDAPVETCWIRDRSNCWSHPGCRFFNERKNPSPSTSSHRIGCRKQTMCNLIKTSRGCNQYEACEWVQGRCERIGTPASRVYNPECWKDGKSKEMCEDLGDKCEWVHGYGCRNKPFCGFDRNDAARCRGRPGCVWDSSADTCRVVPPTPSPTKAPTTPEPTPSPVPPTTPPPTPFRCSQTEENNRLYECRDNMGGILEPPGQNRGDMSVENYCGNLCLEYQGPTDDFPLWGGCRSWSYRKDQGICILNNCLPGGPDELEATSVTTNNWRSAWLGSDCFPGDGATPSPTISCRYDNAADPPNFTNRRFSSDCQLFAFQANPQMQGSARQRLDWCEEKCSNNIEGCTNVLFLSTGDGSRQCEFYSCGQEGEVHNQRVYRSNMIDSSCQ